MTLSMSPPCVDRTSAPLTTLVRWIGTATETIVSPKAFTRTIDEILPDKASAISGRDLPFVTQLPGPRGGFAGEKKRWTAFHARWIHDVSSPRASEASLRGAGVRELRVCEFEQKHAVAIVYSTARMRRSHQAMENWADPLGIDRKGDRVFVGRRRGRVFGRSQLQQLFRIYPDRIRVNSGGSRNRGRYYAGLGFQTLRLRLDDVGAKMVQPEEAEDQDDKAAEV